MEHWRILLGVDTMKARTLMIGFMALSGCASGTFERLPRQDEAEAIVWHQLLGRDDEPPPVEWIDGYVSGHWGGCTLIGWKVQVTTNLSRKIGPTKYAHELIHYDHWLRTGDVDPLHFRADWSIEATANLEMAREEM